MTELVITERLDEGVALIRLNRPEALNALNIAIREALAKAFSDLHDDPGVLAIVLTGDDKAFAAGADLKEFAETSTVEIMKRKSERHWNAVAATPAARDRRHPRLCHGGRAGIGDGVRSDHRR